jgi:hypothetical protein
MQFSLSIRSATAHAAVDMFQQTAHDDGGDIDGNFVGR